MSFHALVLENAVDSKSLETLEGEVAHATQFLECFTTPPRGNAVDFLHLNIIRAITALDRAEDDETAREIAVAYCADEERVRLALAGLMQAFVQGSKDILTNVYAVFWARSWDPS